ncbi:tyrosine-type recombinase/integrase [Antarcticirhabdus aurantiaca]|uniref:Tyrosine-type recombinase/integrase n=1 Tax=Antarcticirhabdus aurantiaca TaxID=2606717 RepID=A0ACD4NHN3_9HYPH|nr:tyrosine-type recombinase/integrase [Jeongeuplla avenae]
MSVFKGPKSPFYQYDFQIDGRRFHGSTKAKNKKDADAVERELKAKAKADLEQEKKTGSGPITMRFAAGRYWTEVGEHHKQAKDTFRELERLVGFFGKDKRLDEIKDADVAAFVSWRRKQTVKGRKASKDGTPAPLIAPRTVNAGTILLSAIFLRAERTWRYSLPHKPHWRSHMLKQPQERVRELDQHEGEALDAAVRDDYAPWLEFARLTGLRRNETLIRWQNVNIFAKRITTIGKGNREVSTPITPDVQAILDQCVDENGVRHHPEFVFTFVCKRTRNGQVRGRRYPITSEGAKTQWRRLRERAKVQDFRFHDIRHDVATKLLRATGNLKLVQRALNHSDIKTTTKYAAVYDDDVAAALAAVGNSRNNPRTDAKDVA